MSRKSGERLFVLLEYSVLTLAVLGYGLVSTIPNNSIWKSGLMSTIVDYDRYTTSLDMVAAHPFPIGYMLENLLLHS